MSKNNLLRITQINAVYLDKEIYKLFTQQVQECIKFLPPGFIAPFETEINLIVRLLILYYSLLENGCTFGQQLLCLKYEDISQTKRLLYIFANCFDYIKTKTEFWKPNHSLNKKFFKHGSKPLLIERILRLNQVYAQENAQRHFESKYLSRELLWNGLIELFVYIIPLLNYHKVKRKIINLNPFRSKGCVKTVDVRSITIFTKCPHCTKTPVHPHHMGCAHIFCYMCLKANQVADPNYECPLCGYCSSENLCKKIIC